MVNEKLKKILNGIKTTFFIIGVILTAGGLFFFRKSINRRRIQRITDLAADAGTRIDTARDNNNEIGKRIERSEELASDAKRNNRNALEANRRAQEILGNAKSKD